MDMLEEIIYQGKSVPFSLQVKLISLGLMFGFLKEDAGRVAIANRIFEMVLHGQRSYKEQEEGTAMKRIIYTQRVEVIESYQERRDCADVEIAKLIWECGFLPIPVNNIPGQVQTFLAQVRPDGVILTGGNDLSKYGGNAPERDETEKRIIDHAVRNQIPVYGFCRGMQMIADYFGAGLARVEHHVAVRHRLEGSVPWNGRTVNSFHNMAVRAAADDLVVEARSEDGVIEAVLVRDRKIYGTMWHPERERPYEAEDIRFIKQIFAKEGE